MNHGAMTAEAVAQFGDGINMVLHRWAALRMAIENEWGGRDSLQKAQQLGHNLFNFLSQSKGQIYVDDVEDILYEFMDSLNTEIGDGSVEEVAEKLMVMREECLEGNFNSIKTLRETNPPFVSYVQQNGDDDEDSDEDDGGDATRIESSAAMEVDAPKCQSRLDENRSVADETTSMKDDSHVEDGWTVVSSKRVKREKKLKHVT